MCVWVCFTVKGDALTLFIRLRWTLTPWTSFCRYGSLIFGRWFGTKNKLSVVRLGETGIITFLYYGTRAKTHTYTHTHRANQDKEWRPPYSRGKMLWSSVASKSCDVFLWDIHCARCSSPLLHRFPNSSCFTFCFCFTSNSKLWMKNEGAF